MIFHRQAVRPGSKERRTVFQPDIGNGGRATVPPMSFVVLRSFSAGACKAVPCATHAFHRECMKCRLRSECSKHAGDLGFQRAIRVPRSFIMGLKGAIVFIIRRPIAPQF